MLKVDIKEGNNTQKKVVLEEFDLNRDDSADEIAKELGDLVFPEDATWKSLLQARLCVVHDDVMSFLATHATEIVTRVSIDPATGTAKDGQLWTEENLPAESVLVGLAEELPTEKTRPRRPGEFLDSIQRDLLSTPIQLGGKATVGRGRCQLRLVGGGS